MQRGPRLSALGWLWLLVKKKIDQFLAKQLSNSFKNRVERTRLTRRNEGEEKKDYICVNITLKTNISLSLPSKSICSPV